MGKDDESKKIGENIIKIFQQVGVFITAIIKGIRNLTNIKILITGLLLILISVFIRMYYGPFSDLIDGFVKGYNTTLDKIYPVIIKYFFNYLPGIIALIYLAIIGSIDNKKIKVK